MHVARLSSPKNWKIPKKSTKWIVRPSPGPHPLNRCLPISIIIRDKLGYAETMKEVKKILNNGDVFVNHKVVRNLKYPVGIMDAINIKKFDESYLLLINEKGYLSLSKVKHGSDNARPLKIKNKTHIKSGKVQLNFYDGTNMVLPDRKQDKYSVGDSLLIDMKQKKIIRHLRLEKGAHVYLTAGKHVGKVGVVEDMKKNQLFEDTIIVKIGNESIETLKSYAFVIEEKTLS